jgi:hypothetical protein
MQNCMRRAPVLAQENTASINELKTELGSIRKAISEVQEAQRDLPDIRGRLQNIESWQTSAQAQMTQIGQTADQASQQASAALPQSRFEQYLQNKFGITLARITKVEATSAMALPISKFEEYLRGDFQSTLDRLSVAESVPQAALPYESFND